MELAALKVLLDVGKAAEHTLRGSRFIERLSNENMDVYTLLSAKNMVDDIGVKGDAGQLNDNTFLEHPENIETSEMDDALEDGAMVKQELAQKLKEESEHYLSDKREQFLKEERNPSKLPADTAKRLAEKCNLYNASLWNQLDANGRLNLLQDIFKDMGEEACLPNALIKSTKLGLDNLNGASATTNIFIKPNNLSNKFDVALPPGILFDKNNIYNPGYPFKDAVETLYHETIHVMQQQCLTEPGNTFPYFELENEWGKDVSERIGGNNPADYMEYLKEPMETYAHQQASIFTKMYHAMAMNHL